MFIPPPRDLAILQYLYNDFHGTKDTAKKFDLTEEQVSKIVAINAKNMASLLPEYNLEHAKNVCTKTYGLSRECCGSLISQVTAPVEEV